MILMTDEDYPILIKMEHYHDNEVMFTEYTIGWAKIGDPCRKGYAEMLNTMLGWTAESALNCVIPVMLKKTPS